MDHAIGTDAFRPQNTIETELVRAAHEPHLRPGFLRELLDAEIFLALLLPDGERIEADAHGHAVIPEGARLEVKAVDREAGPAMPLFTAPARAQSFYRADHVIAPDRVRGVLLRHPGTRFVLNPGSDYALDLTERDVDAMLRGDFTAH
ncbi:SseB family protein [Enterovirga sp.]|uniref:SseB family protein n=1 Tax=Enterovirga sp. TaxID=2026350 RepID=UPI0026131CF3|nr:SseB family protein [Enterovirga sp.]MDB5592806.1 SseB family protein [Enterovirga sp.]